MSAPNLRHKDILSEGRLVHLTRAILSTSRPKTLHKQDFYELIWVQNDTLRHHLSDGFDTLREGDLLFVRPDDAHGLQGKGEAPMVVSLCIHPSVVKGMVKRHPQLDGHLFWAKTDTPVTAHRDSIQLAALNTNANQLERSIRDLLAAEAFLLPLCAALLPDQSLPAEAPDWLLTALKAAQSPQIFQDGAAGLVRVTGRGHPHVARTMRRWTGQSPSDYINGRRMSFAAAKLAGGSDTLAEIASDCGIPNLSHFHRLFREAHGMTPQRYRRAHQRNILQPEPGA